MIQCAVGQLPNGTNGIDVTSPVTAATAAQYASQGYQFIVRYIGRGDGSHVYQDLTAAEAQIIVDAGLGLGVVQHPLKAGWHPTQALGQAFGAGGVQLATAAGMPPGVTVWVDVEGVAAGTPAQNVIDYCTAWYAAVQGAGFVPGIYIGANPGLTAQQLYELPMKSYWRGGSSAASGVPADIPVRGYQMIQTIHPLAGGGQFDTDVANVDNLGDSPFWCLPVA